MIFNFFNFLQKNNIDYCLINGYEDVVKNNVTDSDIDLLFKKNDFLKIEKIIQSFCELKNYKLVQIFHQDVWAKNIFVFDPETHEILNLDLYGELSRKEVIFFEEQHIFNSLSYYENIPILSEEKELINYLVKKLDKNDFTQVNFNHLRSLFLKSEEVSKKKIAQFFPSHYAIISEAFLNNKFTNINDNRDVLITDFYNVKTIDLKRKYLNKIRAFKRIIYPTGLTISFLGPDGSGKSTIIEELFNNNLPFRRKEYFHLKPIKNKTSSDTNTVVTDPHQYKRYSKGKSYIKLLYFVFQYNFGWLKNIIALKIKSSLIVFDRYFDDLIVDTKRYRFGGSIAVAKFIRKFIPKPDIYFVLVSDARIIHQRKQEVPFEELERQIKAYQSLVDGERYFEINVNRSPKEITKEIITIMMNKLNERY